MFKTKKKLIINITFGLIFVGVILSFYTTFSINTEYRFDSLVYEKEFIPKYVCGQPRGVDMITISDFNSGDISIYSEDKEIVSSTSMEYTDNKGTLKINYGSKAGRTNLMVKDGDGNSSALVIVDATYMSLSSYGVVSRALEEVVVNVIGENLGNITCKSSDEGKGTCRVDGNKIIVTPLKSGTSVNIDVYNNHSYEDYQEVCGQEQFVVVIQGDV